MTGTITRAVAPVPHPSIAPPAAGAALPVAPEVIKAVRPRRRRAWVKGVLATFLIVIVCLLAYERLVTGLMHDQRQRHLSATVVSGRPKISSGDAYGVLQIPTLGINEVVVLGANVTNLRSGPTVSIASVLPGQHGAVVIFGHRSIYGAPFKGIGSLKAGDSVYLEARNKAPVIEYTVRSVASVSEQSAALGLAPVADNSSMLVLVTSSSGRFGNGSVVVTATAVDSVAGGPAVPRAVSLQATDPDEPAGVYLLYANLGIIASAVMWRLLHTRGRSMLATAVLCPVVIVAFLWLALFTDGLLAATR